MILTLKMKNKIKCELKSWDEMRAACEKIAEKIINSNYKADIIIAIARGGLVPAMNLSDTLGIKDLICLQVEHWGKTAEKDAKAELKHGINIDLSKKNVLIADDISDTGDSLEITYKFIEKLNPGNIKVATIHYVNTSKFKPDFYAEVVDRTNEFIWAVYPWNIVEDTINLIGKLKSDISISCSDINKIKQELENNYEFSVDEKTLKKIILEMERRDLK